MMPIILILQFWVKESRCWESRDAGGLSSGECPRAGDLGGGRLQRRVGSLGIGGDLMCGSLRSVEHLEVVWV